ncbi:MAG TPA: sensor domain-containing protein [Steroidobacteraceae bacterium]|nr:sensor domain-containing protein [Steroidobacteraceae bacterium]
MNRSAPRSVEQYLAQLKAALAGEDPALQQDALYDAEEYLRAEIAQHKDKSESDVLELIASTYGAPEEVADAYRTTEATVRAALAPAPRPKPQSALGRFFAVFGDSRAYTSLFFMLLSLATGIIYFTVTVTGLSMSAGLIVLIIGVPFFLLFLGLVRVLALAEGRLVEALTGTRMPRRPVSARSDSAWYQRIIEVVKDRQTWTAMFYMLLQLPLGIIYFTIAVAGLSIGLALTGGPIFQLLAQTGIVHLHLGPHDHVEWAPVWALPLVVALGVLMLTLLMHLARAIGIMHGHLAKALLVRSTG